MKIIYIKRNTQIEKQSNTIIGELITKVTYIRKYFLGLPIKTLHKYRETYYREVKNYDDCILFV
jgi:hypothetical protein